MTARVRRGRDVETTIVGQLSVLVSCISFLVYLRHNGLLLYGDAIAHINIARRVLDSRTPGLLQLGTVWLPLPHLLLVPFVASDRLWQSGVGGSVPSLAAYIISVIGIFRLVRVSLRPTDGPRASRPAWLAALIYAANPNLIYLQTTAMTETLYLALFVWTLVFFVESVRAMPSRDQLLAGKLSPLTKCGLCLAAACFTRYDGWLLAAILLAALPLIYVKLKSPAEVRRGLAGFILLAIAGPALWIGYNAVVYRNPLEFANGPYSARAIEQNSSAITHPGAGDLPTAASYFLKAAELNMAPGNWGRLWLLFLLAGTIIILFRNRTLWPLLLLWVPVPFYALSVAYGGVPIYVPSWWPLSSYNLRYGIELLPAFSVFTAVTANFLMTVVRYKRAASAVMWTFVVPTVLSYGFVWHAQPACVTEARANSQTRLPFEATLAANLRMLPPDSTLLMYLGDHVGALERAGIPLRRVINEGNHRPWKHPDDLEGLWERALANPAGYADYVIAFAGDPVSRKVDKANLASLVVIRTLGQPPATIYWTHSSTRPHQ